MTNNTKNQQREVSFTKQEKTWLFELLHIYLTNQLVFPLEDKHKNKELINTIKTLIRKMS